MSRERRLGRGLAALLGEPTRQNEVTQTTDLHSPAVPRIHDPSINHTSVESVRPPTNRREDTEGASNLDKTGVMLLNVYEIEDNPFQPRREFSEPEIASLAESLKEHDMLQPILVRRVEGRWQLISGERRLRAAIKAGWTDVPARVRQADDRLVAELAIVENLQRKDLNPLEKALSFRRYLDEHDATQEELGQRLKIDRSTISNLLRLLELPDSVQEALRGGSISAGHARALLPLGDESAQTEFCSRIQREGISVRETERIVQERIQLEDGNPPVATAKKKKSRTRSSHIASLEQQMRIFLGTKVDIRQSTRGRGQMVIHFRNNEEFDRLRSLIVDQDVDDRQSYAG